MFKSPYSLDSLESNDDLLLLFDALKSVIDSQGNPACFTSNMVMANPNFSKIKNNNYTKFEHEDVSKTLKKYIGRDRVIELWKYGLKSKIFFPQFHAREHIRYWDWINDLSNGDEEALLTFKLNMCGVPKSVSKSNKSYFLPPYIDESDLMKKNVNLENIISEGLGIFEKIFGFASKSTIAPNCGWTNAAEDYWFTNNVKYIQGGYIQESHKSNKIIYIPHFLGETNNKEMCYLVRNCTFEPAYKSNQNYWRKTFNEVKNAFENNMPAIISSHRVNYIGAIDELNREQSITQLRKLLNEIVVTYPDVIFLNSCQLGDMIQKIDN